MPPLRWLIPRIVVAIRRGGNDGLINNQDEEKEIIVTDENEPLTATIKAVATSNLHSIISLLLQTADELDFFRRVKITTHLFHIIKSIMKLIKGNWLIFNFKIATNQPTYSG